MSQSIIGRKAGVWTIILGAVLLLFGIPILAGGVWLISLGGSWYYAPAGLALVLSGYHMMRGNIGGAQLYVLTWVATLISAYWEVGFNGWALVPRVVAPTVLLVLLLTTIPSLARQSNVIVALAAIGINPDQTMAQGSAEEAPQAEPADAEKDTATPQNADETLSEATSPDVPQETASTPAKSPQWPSPMVRHVVGLRGIRMRPPLKEKHAARKFWKPRWMRA